MNKEELRRIAKLSALNNNDVEKFQNEFVYIAKAMSNIDTNYGDFKRDSICASDLRRDTPQKCENSGIFEDSDRCKDGYIITKKVIGV